MFGMEGFVLRPDEDVENADWLRRDWSETGVKTLDDLYVIWEVPADEEHRIAFLRWFVTLPISRQMPKKLSTQVQKILEG